MATRKIKQTITIKENDYTVSSVLDNIDEAPLELQIAAYYKITETAAKVAADLTELKKVAEIIGNKITTESYDNHITALMNRGLIRYGETPVFRLENNDGSIYNISISGGVDECFEIDSKLSDKTVLGSLDEKYKKLTISLDKKVIKEEFEQGVLPPSISLFCSKNPTDITKLRKTVEKEADPQDDEETN